MKKTILALLGVLVALPAAARNFTYEYEGQTLTYTVIDEDAKTCKPKDGTINYGLPGNNVSGKLIIPAVAKDGDDEYSVTSIGSAAFCHCSGLTSVTIPNSVTSIESDAFHYSTNLTEVTIPNSVTSIGSAAFRACMGLTEVTIPNSVNSIGSAAFEHSGLREVAIPNSVNSISESAFSYCSSLTEVTIPNSVTSISESAFYCSGLASVTIPNSVTSIGSSAFTYCSHLASVTIPNSVTSIGSSAFSHCSGLKKSTYPSDLPNPFEDGIAISYPREGSIIEDGFVYDSEKKTIYFAPLSFEGEYSIPTSVTSIGSSAFSYCSGLTEVTIPNSVTSIGSDAFRACSGLTGVTIPNSVNSIEESSFYGCSGLKKSAYPSDLSNPFEGGIAISYPREGSIIEDGVVYDSGKNTIYFAPLSFEGEYSIPTSVTSIGNNAFSYCSALTSVIATSMTPPTMDETSFSDLYASVPLSVPDNAFTSYLATNWSLFENIRRGDSEKASKTFETGNLKYRLIPGPTNDDKNLAVVIPGDYSSLTEVTIPERITYSDNGTNDRYYVDVIGYKAFNGCSNLATVTFNSRNAARSIGDYAFAGTKISTITLPETIESIGDYTFSDCKSLTDIVIPGSTETIGNYAFNGCSSLSSIEIPGSVKTIGDYAFYGTSKLGKVIFNEGLESIGKYAFSATYDRKIEPINIPSTLKSVENDAFYNFNCQYVNISNLASWCNIDFANSNSNPAAHRKGLYLNGEIIKDLVIPQTVEAIKDYAFCYSSTLENVTFNEALQSIGISAFSDCSSLESVTFNDALQSIGDYAFNGCSGLTAIVIPGSVTTIGKETFNNSHLSDLTFEYGADAIEIGSAAFPAPSTLLWDRPIDNLNLSTGSLTSLTLGNSVDEIPAALFKGVTGLTTLSIGNSVTAIGDEAFSGCALTEVVLPPSVETIGASAFAGNTGLTSIIMGHKVKSIDEKAFDLCPAQTVSITAQTPPTAPDNTFSNYTGSLYVQGKDAVEAYYDSDYCWFQFEGHVMIEPTALNVEGEKTITGKPGDTFQLTATLYPADVTLPQIFWRSTNPEIATVDHNGLVTIHADMSDIMATAETDDETARTCKIIAESLYANGPVAEVTVTDTSLAVDDIFASDESDSSIDPNAPVEVYNLQGVMVSRSMQDLAPGLYIVRQNTATQKIYVQ